MQEIRFAARMLVKNKGWTAMALLALTLGLGANAAIFSVVGLMIWTPLPYPHPAELVYISNSNARQGFNRADASLPEVRDWGSGSTLASVAATQTRSMALTGQGEPLPVPAMQVSPEFFPTLGVKPLLGRVFTAAESVESESRVAVLSNALWQGLYGGKVSALGRDIRLDGANYTIVGVMPANFHFIYREVDVWVPLSLKPRERERDARTLATIARLKPGATVAQANSEVRAMSERAERQFPAAGLGWRGVVRPLTYTIVDSGAQIAAGSMMGAVGFVLLIACANVASLLLARGTQRRRELAIRASLGASRGTLIRLQLIESVLLAVLGGGLGIVSAIWTIPFLKRIAPPTMRLFEIAALDWNTLLFGLALSLVTAVLAGTLPAWLLSRGDLAGSLQDASRGSTGGRHVLLKSLVTAEIALALVLVACGTLMTRSLIRHTNFDAGFDQANLVVGGVRLAQARYPEQHQVVDFYSKALEALRRDGGVESAALVDNMPLAGGVPFEPIRFEGDPDAGQERFSGRLVVSPGYFAAMRIPVLAGREFAESDHADAAPVAIVNGAFVKRFWPREPHPVGRRVWMEDGWRTVVGVARSVQVTAYDPPWPEVYLPHAQAGSRNMILVARGRRGTAAAVGALRAAVARADRDQPIFRLQSFADLLSNRRSGPRATAQVLSLLAAVALILAAVGTYGVMAYTTEQRVREIGIRLALGATRADVFGMVLRGGAVLTGLALVIGLPAAYGCTRLLRGLDPGIGAGDSAGYAAVTVMLALVALVATVVPAWRAMRVEPTTVLRCD